MRKHTVVAVCQGVDESRYIFKVATRSLAILFDIPLSETHDAKWGWRRMLWTTSVVTSVT